MMDNNRHTVLFVDDEVSILSSIRREVMDEDFYAIFANNAQEALQAFESHEISVIVTDMRMPGMDGLTLLKIIREKHPHTVRIVLSGYTQLSQVLATINLGEVFQFISKPWEMREELIMGVWRAIDRYQLEKDRRNLQATLEKKNRAYQKILQQMEQKIANERKDLANLKRLNHWVFKFWKKHYGVVAGKGTETSLLSDTYITLIEEIQLAYIDVLPTCAEAKTGAEMINSIRQACAGQIVFADCDDYDAMKFSGYHCFLIMTLKVLVYLLGPAAQSPIDCSLSTEISEGEKPFARFSLSHGEVKLSPLELSRLTIGCSLLNEIGKIYNIVILEKGKKEASSIQVVWQLAENMKSRS